MTVEPDEIIEQMDEIVEDMSSERDGTAPLDEDGDPIAGRHRDAVRRGARTADTER